MDISGIESMKFRAEKVVSEQLNELNKKVKENHCEVSDVEIIPEKHIGCIPSESTFGCKITIKLK